MRLAHNIANRLSRVDLVFAGWLVAALAVTTALRAPGLSAPLGIDEGGVALIARSWLEASSNANLYGDYWLDRPPLLLLAMGVFELLGGATGIRVLGWLAACALVVLVGVTARTLSGRRALVPSLVAACALASSPILFGDRTYAELLAAVPATASIALLVRGLTGERPRVVTIALAGMCASVSFLVKQSFLDAGLAGTVAIAVWLWSRSRCVDNPRPPRHMRHDIRTMAAWGVGLMAPILATLVWAETSSTGATQLFNALFGFRVDALDALNASHKSALERLPRLTTPLFTSGLVLFVPLSIAAVIVLARSYAIWAGALLAAWLFGATVGVLGGGYYWAHYLLQLVAPLSLSAGIVASRWRTGLPMLAAAAAFVATITSVVGNTEHANPALRAARSDELVVGRFIADNAQVGDTAHVIHARANVMYYTHLQSPMPYLWSSMYRARTDALPRLAATLESAQRPTFLVLWQPYDTFGMGTDRTIERSTSRHYRLLQEICGRTVLLRRDTNIARPLVPAHERRCDVASVPAAVVRR